MERLIDDYCCGCGASIVVPEFSKKTCSNCGRKIIDCADCTEECGVEK